MLIGTAYKFKLQLNGTAQWEQCTTQQHWPFQQVYMSALFIMARWQDGKKYIATVASIWNQQQQEINIWTFTQNSHLEHKRPSLFIYADKERKCSHIRNVLIFIANPTFRFLFAGVWMSVLVLIIKFKLFIMLNHLFKSPFIIITHIIITFIFKLHNQFTFRPNTH